jgi:hypothetical protein
LEGDLRHYACLEVDQIRQMAQLQEENAHLKQLMAELKRR